MTHMYGPGQPQGDPLSPHPTSVVPYPGPGLVAVKPRLSAWVWSLAALAVVLLAVAGAFGLLYQNVRAAHERQLADRSAQIDELEAELQRLDDQRLDLETERDELRAALDGTVAQVGQHTACPDAVVAFSEAVSTGTQAQQEAAFEAMVAACDLTL